MSPFDLRGPDFLFFYLVLGSVVLAILFFLRRFIDPVGAVKVDMSDPYFIAFLRGGKNEVLRVATLSLVHRKLLKVSNTLVSVTSPGVVDSVRVPVEQKLLAYFTKTAEGASVFSDSACSFVAESYGEPLEQLGLLPDASVQSRRSIVLTLALLFLLGFALLKILVALSRGHTNIGFLIALAAIFGFMAFRIVSPRLTERGRGILKDLQFLFGPLRSRPAGSLGYNDVTLLAAVFGIGAVPALVFPYAATLYPKAASSGGSCGSGCGSAGGDSGGSCGGGGCGGGCGGCGG